METGNHDLSIASRNGELWEWAFRVQYNNSRMGRYDLYESGDVLYIRTSGTILLSDLEEEYGIRHQLDESWAGLRHGLVRGKLRVKEVIALGSHDMFIADVVNVQADDRYLDPETGAFDMQKADLLAYSHGKYYGLVEFVGKFGWSVKKKK